MHSDLSWPLSVTTLHSFTVPSIVCLKTCSSSDIHLSQGSESAAQHCPVSCLQCSLTQIHTHLRRGMALTLMTSRETPFSSSAACNSCYCPQCSHWKFLSVSLGSYLLSCHRHLQLPFTDFGALNICPLTFLTPMYFLSLFLFSLTYRTLASWQAALILDLYVTWAASQTKLRMFLFFSMHFLFAKRRMVFCGVMFSEAHLIPTSKEGTSPKKFID